MTTQFNEPELLAMLRRGISYLDTLGIEIESINSDGARLHLPLSHKIDQAGVPHGGAVCSLLDASCAMAALGQCWPEQYISTISLNTAFHGAFRGTKMTCEAWVIKAGRRVIMTIGEVRDDAGGHIATATSQLVPIPVPAAMLSRPD